MNATFSEIRYLGHAAVFLEGATYTVAIDPWLVHNPSCPDQWKNPKKIDLIILTHGHSDHASEAIDLAKAHNAPVVATYELGALLMEDGLPQELTIQMNKGGTIKGGYIRLVGGYICFGQISPNRQAYIRLANKSMDIRQNA